MGISFAAREPLTAVAWGAENRAWKTLYGASVTVKFEIENCEVW